MSFSIGTLDRSVWKLTEPGTPPPDRRVEALRRLTALGIPCGVLVAPVLPGLSDSEAQLTEVVEACADAGALSISGVALHLRGPMRTHYLDWLQGVRPDLVRLHRERFRRGAYQNDDERQRMEGIVKVAARRCGVTGRNRYRGTTPGGAGAGAGAGCRRRPERTGGRTRPATAPALRGAPTRGRALPKIVASCRVDRRCHGRAAGPSWVSLALLAASVLVALPCGPSSTGSGTGTAAAATPPAPTDSSYAIVDAAGGVMTFGGAAYDGDTLEVPLDKPIVGGAADPNGGYWLVASDGGVFSFGNAQFWGSTGGIALNKPIVGMAATPDGDGYWLVASDGGIFAFGDAQFWGSTGGIALNKPIVGMAAAAHGNGYWLVASDGGIFAFGDAPFLGSTGGIHLNEPVVGMAATADGGGYWMVASDGGIFTYGDASFWGSAGSIHLSEPIVAMTPTPDGGRLLAGRAGRRRLRLRRRLVLGERAVAPPSPAVPQAAVEPDRPRGDDHQRGDRGPGHPPG